HKVVFALLDGAHQFTDGTDPQAADQLEFCESRSPLAEPEVALYTQPAQFSRMQQHPGHDAASPAMGSEQQDSHGRPPSCPLSPSEAVGTISFVSGGGVGSWSARCRAPGAEWRSSRAKNCPHLPKPSPFGSGRAH